MLKNKKIIIIVIIVFVIAVALLTFYIYSKNTYSFQDVQSLLNSTKKTSNIHVKTEETVKNITTYTDVYIKDNAGYTIVHDEDGNILSEAFYDLQNSNLTTIVHSEKSIISISDENHEISIPSINNNFFTVSQSAKFKYMGKEYINEKQCIKVCLTSESFDQASKNYYYIDLEDNRIIKCEQYNGNNLNELEKEYEIIYRYSYDDVLDSDIKSFDVNDYPNYDYNK